MNMVCLWNHDRFAQVQYLDFCRMDILIRPYYISIDPLYDYWLLFELSLRVPLFGIVLVVANL